MPAEERFTGANSINAGKLSPYWGEHVARYAFALPFLKDRTVLDIACGTGYGIGLLEGNARFVVGVDISLEAATAAKLECSSNAAVLLGSGLALPFSDGTFDVVTSFETLEHLHQRSQFLEELARVLKSGGMLILSTPNANYTNPVDGKPANPFHIFEYLPRELHKELSACFEIEQFLGQSLDETIKIPPFYDAQLKLPRGLGTQSQLFAWKVMNKLPFSIREGLSNAIWKKPFYPTDSDYVFSEGTVERAPVLVAICRRK